MTLREIRLLLTAWPDARIAQFWPERSHLRNSEGARKAMSQELVRASRVMQSEKTRHG